MLIDMFGYITNLFRIAYMNDERIVGRAPLRLEYASYRPGIEHIRTEAVDGFRRKCNHPSAVKKTGSLFGRIGYDGLHFRHLNFSDRKRDLLFPMEKTRCRKAYRQRRMQAVR